MASNGKYTGSTGSDKEQKNDTKTSKDKDDKKRKEEESFKIRHIFAAFASLPRIGALVWSTNRFLTASMALVSLLRGFIPASSVWIGALVIDSVVHAIQTHDTLPVWWFVGLQLAITLLDRLFSTLSNIVQQLLQERVAIKVQSLILEKANSLDLAFFENSEFYDKLRRASDEANYKPVTIVSQTFDLARTLVTFFSMIFVLVHLAWWLAIVAVAVPFPAFIANSRYGWRGYQLMRHQSPQRRRMYYITNLLTVDQFNKEIKLFNLGRYFLGHYRRLANKFYDENKHILVSRYMTSFLWSGLSLVANSAIYIYVALQAVIGRITLGGLTLYTGSAMQVGTNFQGILDGVSNTYENNLFVSTLFEFLEYEPKIVSPQRPRPIVAHAENRGPEIEFRNVSFTYPNKDPQTEMTLKGVSFTIPAGEALALVGRNGAGKTTIVKLLTRLYDPSEGEILLGGRNIKEYELDELRAQVGVIFQDYVDYSLSARENIGVGRVTEIENAALVESAAQKSGANAVIEKLPEGYETMLGNWFEEGTQLSGGEWQKIALARAFMRDAPVLILDEPTSSLDAQAEYDVFAKFRVLTRGKTAIFISHRFSTVRLADRIIVLEHGKIIENGSHRELVALGGRYAELFNLQAEAYR